jgi:DNA-binding winged helix-turn-helix (wHTH) protein
VLASKRVDVPGKVMLPGELIAAVWPGEIIAPHAAKNRLHVALSALRKAGLAEIIQRVDGGYRLDPGVPILLV